jgi:predicted dehydrogenase
MIASWKRKIRMGMVGGGEGAFIGGVHRMAAALDGQIELTAGCFSRDWENTKTTGEKLYVDPNRCYRSYEEMAEKEARLDEDKRIDFVSIVTPNKSHFPIAKTFLEAGFHVVCDKPMTYSVDEAKTLRGIVLSRDLLFCLTHNYTGNPLVREARELFVSGELGDPRKVVVEYLQDFLAAPLEKEGMKQAVWRTDPAQSGAGGTLGDIGSHAFNLLEYITGDRVAELCADISTFLPDRSLDEDANILVRLKGGGKGIITVSQIAIGEENALSIKAYGSKGGITWDQEAPNRMRVHSFNNAGKLYTRAAPYLNEESARLGRTPGGHPEGYLEAFANIYRDFTEALRAVLDGNPLPREEHRFPDAEEGLRGMLFIERAVESGKAGSVWKSL